MKHKAAALLLCLVLVFSAFSPVFGMEKSIQPISTETNIDNADRSARIRYEGEDARVYYGSGGIYIISGEKQVHLSTNFSVVKLEPVGDVNKDGYTDFFTFQDAPNYTEQLMTIDGKDGSVIASLSLTHQGYDDSIGYVQTNSYIQQLLAAKDGSVIVLYDYSVAKISPKTAEIIWEKTFDNNLWRIVSAEDQNKDGSEDFAFTGQNNLLAVISGADGELISEWHPCETLTINDLWGMGLSVDAVLNMWDVYCDGESLYATSEDGHIFTVDLDQYTLKAESLGSNTMDTREKIQSAEIGLMDQESLKAMLEQYNIRYTGTSPEFLQTGVTDWQYMGYRFADARDGYLLINCYMGASDGAASYTDSMWTPATVLYNTETGEVENIIQMNQTDCKYQKNCFIDYEGTTCIAVVNSIREKAVSISYYDLEGTVVYQREAGLDFINYNCRYELSEDGGALRIEALNTGCAVFSPDLKSTEYAYNKISTALLSADDDGVYVTSAVNGNKVRITRYNTDMNSELWSCSATDEFTNKGFEFIRTDRDYDEDGTNDILAIVNSLNEEGFPDASWYIIISGADGSEILNTRIKTDQYWDYEKRMLVTLYHTSNSIDTVRDLDYDGKPELLCGTSVISSKWMNVIGDLYGDINAEGNPIAIGDTNEDGITDYIVISEKETRLYQSSIGFSWGYVQLNYNKTNTFFANDKTLQPDQTSGLIGDITGDGASEFVMLAKNDSGFQMFNVYNGATLELMYSLCDYGLNDDGESFTALDIDLNGDGFYEIYGRDNWRYGIYDGQTGELLFDTSTDDTYAGGYIIYSNGTVEASDIYAGEDFDSGYHPDYNVGFWKLDEKPNFIIINDISGDGNPELAFIHTSWDYENYDRIVELLIIAGGSFEELDSIRLNYDFAYGELKRIQNSEQYIALITDQKLSIVDIAAKKVLATFDIKIDSAMQQEEGSVIVSASDGNLYRLNLEKSFELLSELPEESDDYTVNIAWKSLQDLSVMTIRDNNNTVYSGNDGQYDLKLLSGKHDIQLSMNDGQGKTYSENYTVEVAPQTANYTWVAAVLGVMFILALFFGIIRKARIAATVKGASK